MVILYYLIKKRERNQIKFESKYKQPIKIMKVWNGDYFMLKSLKGNRTYKYSHKHLSKMPEGIDDVDSSESDPGEGTSSTGENTEF